MRVEDLQETNTFIKIKTSNHYEHKMEKSYLFNNNPNELDFTNTNRNFVGIKNLPKITNLGSFYNFIYIM